MLTGCVISVPKSHLNTNSVLYQNHSNAYIDTINYPSNIKVTQPITNKKRYWDGYKWIDQYETNQYIYSPDVQYNSPVIIHQEKIIPQPIYINKYNHGYGYNNNHNNYHNYYNHKNNQSDFYIKIDKNGRQIIERKDLPKQYNYPYNYDNFKKR